MRRAVAVEYELAMPPRPAQRYSGPLTVYELYLYFLGRNELWKFFAMFPPPGG